MTDAKLLWVPFRLVLYRRVDGNLLNNFSFIRGHSTFPLNPLKIPSFPVCKENEALIDGFFGFLPRNCRIEVLAVPLDPDSEARGFGTIATDSRDRVHKRQGG